MKRATPSAALSSLPAPRATRASCATCSSGTSVRWTCSGSVTIEYVMLKGVNDSESDAIKLAKLLKGMNVYVNLIPYNETNHIEFKKSNKDNILKFGKILQDNNITVTIRKEYGGQIDAACGQLRSKEVE